MEATLYPRWDVSTQNALFESKRSRWRPLPNSRRYYRLRGCRDICSQPFAVIRTLNMGFWRPRGGLRCEGSWTSEWLTSDIEHTLPHTVQAQQNSWLAWATKGKKNQNVTRPWLNADSSLKTEPRAKRQETLGFSMLHFWDFYKALKSAAVWACPEKSWPFSIWKPLSAL